MSWLGTAVAVGGTLYSANQAKKGAERNADAIERGAEIGSDIQRDALNTSIALARPQLEVGNSALGVLADLFGLAPPSPLNFGDGTIGGGAGLGGSGLGGLGFDPDTPMSATQITQAYRTVFGRDPDPQGLQFHLTRGPRGAGKAETIPGSDGRHPLGDVLGFNSKAGDRRAFTFNEFLAAAQGSPEYQDKKERGILPPTVEGGQFSGNFTGREIKDENARALFFQQAEQANPEQQQAASQGLNLNELVAQNPLIQFNRQQGEQAIDRGAAARGLNQSGGTLKDLATFNQNLSAAGVQDFVLNPLFQLAGFGPQASAQVNQATQNTGNNLTNIALGAADARGSAFQSGANAQANALSNIGGAALNAFGQPTAFNPVLNGLPNNNLTNPYGTGSIDGLVPPTSQFFVPGRD